MLSTGRRVAPTIALTMVVLVAACGDDTAATTTTLAVTTSTTTSSTTTVSETSTTNPVEFDVQTDIDWFVALLNGDEITDAEYEERFSEEFRRQVPFESGFVPVLDQYRPAGPFRVIDRSGEGREGTARLEDSTGAQHEVVAAIDESGQITTLLIRPGDTPELDDPPATLDEAYRRLAEIGSLGMVSAEVVGDSCNVIDTEAREVPVPLGSVFKLYVLAAVGEAVAAGELDWDDEITIRDGLKSIPTGVLQDRPDGDVVTVREAAELMISISDNTAADHLIDLLGREAVEAAMVQYGNSTPELNLPFLSTRELAALKVGPASGLRTQWIDGDEGARRSILGQISDITPADIPLQEWTDPIDPDLVEWFATPDDLCALAVGMVDLVASVPEVGDILGLNPGVPASIGTWDVLWFKGGSEPGLVAMWFMTQSGDRIFLTAGSVVDPVANIDTTEAVLLFAAARDLLAP